MTEGIVTSIRHLLEKTDMDRNLEVAEAINVLHQDLITLINQCGDQDSSGFELMFKEVIDKCLARITFKTKLNIPLYEYFKNGGVITRAIKSTELISELVRRDPVTKKINKIVPYNGFSELEVFKQFLEETRLHYKDKTPTVFIEKDFLELKLLEIENGVYLVNDEPVLVVYKKAKSGVDEFPDYMLKVSKEEVVIYFHHPVEDVWIVNDGTAFFKGLIESIKEEYLKVIENACHPKKAFNFKREIDKIEKRCVAICKEKDKLPPLIKDSQNNTLYQANKQAFPGSKIQDSIVFCFCTKNIITQVSITVIGDTETVYHSKVTYIVNSNKLFQSIDETAIPITERVLIVTVANKILDAMFQNFLKPKK